MVNTKRTEFDRCSRGEPQTKKEDSANAADVHPQGQQREQTGGASGEKWKVVRSYHSNRNLIESPNGFRFGVDDDDSPEEVVARINASIGRVLGSGASAGLAPSDNGPKEESVPSGATQNVESGKYPHQMEWKVDGAVIKIPGVGEFELTSKLQALALQLRHEKELADVASLSTSKEREEKEKDSLHEAPTPLGPVTPLEKAAQDALVVIAAWKITDNEQPYYEISRTMREAFCKAHDELLAALPKRGFTS